MERDSIEASSFLMTDRPSMAANVSRVTWVSLSLALFAMVLIRHAFVFFVPEITVHQQF